MICEKGKNNDMNISEFFKILNKKINTYSDITKNTYYTNPFAVNKRVTVSWVEDTKDDNENDF